MMSKYKIYFIGERTYKAYDENEAIRMAEQHLELIPKQFNMDISGVRNEK